MRHKTMTKRIKLKLLSKIPGKRLKIKGIAKAR